MGTGSEAFDTGLCRLLLLSSPVADMDLPLVFDGGVASRQEECPDSHHDSSDYESVSADERPKRSNKRKPPPPKKRGSSSKKAKSEAKERESSRAGRRKLPSTMKFRSWGVTPVSYSVLEATCRALD